MTRPAAAADAALACELRSRARTALACPAKILVSDALPRDISTFDISALGLGILAQQTLQRGQSCALAFDVRIEGDLRRINAWGNVAYSTPHESSGFRIGICFIDIDSTSKMYIDRLCRQSAA